MAAASSDSPDETVRTHLQSQCTNSDWPALVDVSMWTYLTALMLNEPKARSSEWIESTSCRLLRLEPRSELHHRPTDDFSGSQQLDVLVDLVERESLHGVANLV